MRGALYQHPLDTNLLFRFLGVEVKDSGQSVRQSRGRGVKSCFRLLSLPAEPM